ncbi:MAG TPA: hypothetical protein PKD09_12410 [Aggregatilinea sp.]|uniref:hypothetical protein n=1 Tax=Aggregatilinea sp. TaxID=2806333 RepID=UPI002B744A9C|nr:hypothetical protein [Aggregatilinea sp.]HML22446.1 hypothetical protein [Aggregatilinea sp.]
MFYGESHGATLPKEIIYPVTEEENTPGAVILINRNYLADAMAVASRVQHFPVVLGWEKTGWNAYSFLTRS